MSINSNRIIESDFTGKGIRSIPGATFAGDAETLKTKFDELARTVIPPRHNGLIDGLQASTAATEIGSTGGNIQMELDAKVTNSYVNDRLNSKVDKMAGKGLSDNNYSSGEKTKLESIASGAQVNSVVSVAGKTGAVTLTKADVGLSSVDNTSDAAKPVSSAAQAALNTKAPKNDPTFQTGRTGINIEDSTAPYHNTKISPYGTIRRTDLSGNELAIYPDMNTKKWMLEVAEAASPERRGAIYSEINKPSKADVGLSSVDNTSDAAKPVSSATQAALNTKANTASPSLTGTPTAPTAPVGTNTTQLATTAFVQANKSGGGYGKKYATFVIGTTASGHTATDVDYLCDGTADDVEIQAAINAIKYPIQHGKIIILPGTYNITQQINCYVDIVIEGVNRNTVILKRAFAGNSNDPFLLFSAIDTGLFEIKNIRFDGVKATYTSNNSGIGSMNAGGGDTVRIDNVWFRNFATNAIEINTYQSANVTNCYISEGLNGIKMQGSHISVSGNRISGSGIGVLCNSERSNIWGNTIGGSASGSSITVSGSGNLISGNLLTGKDIVNTGTNNTIVNNKFI